MGLFGKKGQCSICEEQIGKHKISDGFICDNCLGKTKGYLKGFLFLSKRTRSDILTAIQEAESNKKAFESFSETDSVGNLLKIDKSNRFWIVPGSAGSKENPKVFRFDDLIDYELIADDSTIKKSGIGSAVAGGLLFGGVGAIVGGAAGRKSLDAVSSLKIRISTKDKIFGSLFIDLISTKTKKGTFMYNTMMDTAQKLVSAFDMIENEKENHIPMSSPSVADEILKLKQLLDAGALSEQEFQSQKSKLLAN
jgi:hypothetical protein